MADIHTDDAVDTTDKPQYRVRINTGRNTSGVTFEATASMTWSGSTDHYVFEGQVYPVEVALADLREKVNTALTHRIYDARQYDTFVPKPAKERT